MKKEKIVLSLSQETMSVKCEIDVPTLLEILKLLAEHDQKEQIRYFLLQLESQGYLFEEDIHKLAEYYGVGSHLL